MTTQAEERSKYTADEIKALGAKGHAFRNPDGHYSYPIDDAEDLDNAIRAVGRGGASHDAIRAYIIRRAKAMGKSSSIPENWTSGGESKSAQRDPAWEQRRKRWAGSLIGQPARRALRLAPGNIEVRAKADGTGGTKFEFHGYAATFGDSFQMWDKWGDEYDEEVMPDAFSASLRRVDLDTPFLLGHDEAGLPLARTWDTLRLGQDSHGLETLATMNGRRTDVQNLAIAVEDKNINEMSVGFITRAQKWSDDYSRRYLTEMDLHRGDVSVVTLAANPATKGVSMVALPTEVLSRQAAEQRGNPVDQDMGDAPDYNPWKNVPGAKTCTTCNTMQSPAVNFCDSCGAGGDALVRVNDDDVPPMEEEQGAAAALAQRRRELELLSLPR